jgi:hypothetical protein
MTKRMNMLAARMEVTSASLIYLKAPGYVPASLGVNEKT